MSDYDRFLLMFDKFCDLLIILGNDNLELRSRVEALEKRVNSSRFVSRNVGRKKRFSEDEELFMFELRNQGMSYNKISERMNCSVGLVYNVINCSRNQGNK